MMRRFRSADHPEAAGRAPQPGDQAWTLTFPLEDGDDYMEIEIGKKGREGLLQMLAQEDQDDIATDVPRDIGTVETCVIAGNKCAWVGFCMVYRTGNDHLALAREEARRYAAQLGGTVGEDTMTITSFPESWRVGDEELTLMTYIDLRLSIVVDDVVVMEVLAMVYEGATSRLLSSLANSKLGR